MKFTKDQTSCPGPPFSRALYGMNDNELGASTSYHHHAAHTPDQKADFSRKTPSYGRKRLFGVSNGCGRTDNLEHPVLLSSMTRLIPSFGSTTVKPLFEHWFLLLQD